MLYVYYWFVSFCLFFCWISIVFSIYYQVENNKSEIDSNIKEKPTKEKSIKKKPTKKSKINKKRSKKEEKRKNNTNKIKKESTKQKKRKKKMSDDEQDLAAPVKLTEKEGKKQVINYISST